MSESTGKGVPGMSGHTLREQYIEQACEVFYRAFDEVSGRPERERNTWFWLGQVERATALAAMDELVTWMDSRRL